VSAQIGESQLVLKAKPNWPRSRKNWKPSQRSRNPPSGKSTTLTNKIKDTEKKLYGGKIFNSKELGSLQQETAELKKRRSVFDDKSLG